MRRAGLAALTSLLAAPLAACGALGGALGGSGGSAAPGAHVLFLVRPECRTVVARTLAVGGARAFSVLRLEDDDYAPQVGDLLEGPARVGQSVFVFYPPEAAGAREGGRPMPADVAAVGLEPAEARARLDAACGPPPPLPEGR
jgi:hypothetical protein